MNFGGNKYFIQHLNLFVALLYSACQGCLYGCFLQTRRKSKGHIILTFIPINALHIVDISIYPIKSTIISLDREMEIESVFEFI